MGRALAVFCLLVVVIPAHAKPKPAKPKTEAAVRYERGVDLYKEGNYPAALAEFRAALKLQPGFEVLYNIGLCERRVFKYGDAVKTFKDYLDKGGSKVPKDRREAVALELEEIKSLTAEVTVAIEGGAATLTVDGDAAVPGLLLLGPGKHLFRAERAEGELAEEVLEVVSATTATVKLEPKKASAKPGTLVLESDPPGAILTVDGTLAGAAPQTLQLPAGGHQVTAELDGYQLARTEVVLAGGEERKVSVALEQVKAAPPPKKTPFPLIGLIVSVAGLGLIGGGVGCNFIAQSASGRTTALFKNGGTWDAVAQQNAASGYSMQTAAAGLGVAGAVVLAAGVVVMILELLSSPEPAEGEAAQ